MLIKWQRGNFLKFYSKMKIRVGGKDNTIDKIEEGDEFEYDGSILKYAGAEVATSGVRGAVANDWVSLSPDDMDRVDAFVATRDVARATTVNRDLSRVQRGGVTMDTDSLDEETVLEVSDRGKMEKARSGTSPKVITKGDNRRGFTVNASDTDTQDGVTVGKVRSAAKVAVDISSDSVNYAHVIENRGLGKPILDRTKMVNVEGISIKTSVGNGDQSFLSVGGAEDGKEVGKVRHTDKKKTVDGIEVRDTSNIRQSIVAEASAPRQNPPVTKIDTKISPKIRMARRIDPNFPSDWSFSGKLADRMANVKAHGDTPVFLEALYAAEGDQMRKSLEKAYPKQFGQ